MWREIWKNLQKALVYICVVASKRTGAGIKNDSDTVLVRDVFPHLLLLPAETFIVVVWALSHVWLARPCLVSKSEKFSVP